jgi:glycosyltransferase involved in cell wall biosynthesis
MVPIKDLPTLIRAFAIAVRQNGNLRLLLAGGGPLRREIEQLADELRVSERVHFLGWIEDLPRLYATMDVCVISSLNEGTPVAIIEAMAAAKPAIATEVGGVPDVVAHEVTGLLVPPRSPEALAAALLRLAAHPEERARMGEAARRLAAGRYAPERLVDDVEDLYVRGLAEKQR